MPITIYIFQQNIYDEWQEHPIEFGEIYRSEEAWAGGVCAVYMAYNESVRSIILVQSQKRRLLTVALCLKLRLKLGDFNG